MGNNRESVLFYHPKHFSTGRYEKLRCNPHECSTTGKRGNFTILTPIPPITSTVRPYLYSLPPELGSTLTNDGREKAQLLREKLGLVCCV